MSFEDKCADLQIKYALEIEMITFPIELPAFIGPDNDPDDVWIISSGNESYDYMDSFSWVKKIISASMDFGVAGIITVSDFVILPERSNIDNDLWVISGDIPSAYLVRDDAKDVRGAVTIYCEMMESWANQVLLGGDLSNYFPVLAENSKDNALNLISRIEFIRSDIISSL